MTVDYGAPNQRNLHFIERIGDNQSGLVTQHDCLPVNHRENKANIYEITLYCMSEWPSTWNIQENTVDKKFSFAQLRALNVTSEQLYLWSAPLDIAEDYQSYLDRISTSSEPSITTNWYYNCTRPTFGPKCQYSFDEDETSQQPTSKIVYDTYLRNRSVQMNSSCYVHLECDLGSNLLCISWPSICDGIIQCINGTDEEQCWQLEINECDEDEYRCLNGQCIPLSFFYDNADTPDCLDGSDERHRNSVPIYSNLVQPIYKLEEMLCLQYPGRNTAREWERIYGCSATYFSLINRPIDFANKPNTTTDLCWLALNCYLQQVDLSNYFNCTAICQNETCKQIIKNDCPEMFFVPNMPIVFGHIYFAYTKEYILNQTKRSNSPEYICYNEQFCDGFLKNKTLVSFKNTTCRRPRDFQLGFDPPDLKYALGSQVGFIQQLLPECNTVLRRDPTFVCDNSTMYQCMNSSKCIAQIRLLDTRRDCDYGDDEIWNLTGDGICPIKSPRMYFNCTSENRCHSGKIANDGSCQCGLESGHYSCEDENLVQLDPFTNQIYFQDMCDNFTRLFPISINKQEGTDETECEKWPCNNVYTRCDGILQCWNGADELDCHPSSLINCSRHSYVCFSSKTYDYTCLSADQINDGEIDCVGGMDETNTCTRIEFSDDIFFCSDKSEKDCLLRLDLCNNRTKCLNGEDEKICHHIANPNIFRNVGNCFTSNDDFSIRTDTDDFLCHHFKSGSDFKPLYFSLGRMKNTNKQITQRHVSMVETSSTKNRIISEHSHYCYHHPRLRVWLKKDENETRMTCLCPPSHYGSQCQYQNDRVSLTLQFRSFSDSWQTPFIVIISLIDDSDERIIHSHEQLTYLPVQNCKTKYNIDLLYSIRPKNQSQLSSIHIDIYEKVDLSYRGSSLIRLSFPFMPVQRVAIELNIPHTSYSVTNCSDPQCVHGRCIRYFDDPKQSTYCQCEENWSGRYCTIRHNCTCSSDSLCIGKLADGRSICVCPLHKWGFRCFLHDNVCGSKVTCENDGQCIATDRYVISEKRFVCICRKGYSGERCEILQHKIILSFEQELILPESMLIHFIEVRNIAPPENGSIFKMIPIDRSPVTIHWSRSFHVGFVEFIPQNYYLIVVQEKDNRSKPIETTLQSSNRCSSISEIFNESFVQLHLIRRIKSYHIPCQKLTNLSCFYDEVYFCLCTDFEGQRQANCFEFDHRAKRNCRGQSNCANDAQCLQDTVNCPETSICICLPCFYGSRCQFSSSGFGISLDAIIGDHIQPHVNIRYQPVIIQISVTLTVLISVMGLLNGILSMMTFINKQPRETGCGFYLIGSTITTLTISLVFSVKFWILLGAQMTYLTHRSFLLFQCRSIDFVLRSGLFMDQWLNACIAIERAYTVIKGTNFDKFKSKKIAKIVIPVLLFLIIGTNFHEIIYRDLLENDSNDGKRIWCIVTYPANIHLYNLIMNIFHFCTPFVMNLLSAIIIIVKTARLRANAKNEQNSRAVLFSQFRVHKHLIIAPILLVLLATPRLIISFVSGCMKSSGDAWLYLMGYFISFIPPVLTFFIFVVPSKTYKEQFYVTCRRYQRSIRALF